MQDVLTPMLGVDDAAAAIDFYKRAFGAVEEGERYMEGAKIGHAELRIGGAQVMIADILPPHNVSPLQLAGTPVILHFRVDDADAWTNRALAAGAKVIRKPENLGFGRISKLIDPFGHVWMLNCPESAE